jgi:microcystin-dependent protein
MAGSLFGLAFSQFNDLNGKPQTGARLYVYAAGTQTPSTAYKDFALTAGQEHPHPIPTDNFGRFPQFWLADGSYSFRVIDRDGVTIIPYTTTTALGASTGEGGGGSAISAEVLFQTGWPLWLPQTGVVSGFVRMNGRTVGSATSGAAERASADVEALFTYLWTNLSNAACPVSGGRGATAAADWAANKTITLLDMRGRGPFGLDDMGNTATGTRLLDATFGSGDATTVGSSGGIGAQALSQANVPSYNLTLTGLTTTTTPSATLKSYGTETESAGTGGVNIPRSLGAVIPTFPGTVGGTLPSGGSGTTHNNMPPFVLGTWYQKL